jgi:2-keto-4-pentenoate hydratase/2-oxohepta-3-ene-1,7-dioic acid hydratase in catechol pathway
MQLFQTDRGVARRRDDILEVLDTSGRTLYDLILSESLASLNDASITSSGPLHEAVFLSPVLPERLFQVGLNYHSHLKEIGIGAPETPRFAVSDLGDSLGAPDGIVTFPTDAPDQIDHECEIAIVIAHHATAVKAIDAWSVIAGLTACNDISARDVQRVGLARGEMTAGKLLAGFKPFGPGLIAGVEAHGLQTMSLTVNGEQRQDTDTDDMVFSIASIIEVISAQQPLVPGDVIITGSPAGVGFFSGKYLVDGDVVEIFLGDLPPLRTTFTKG